MGKRPQPRNDDSVPAMLADLNRIIHEPARLAILTVLSTCVMADFKYLQTATGLSKGNLSVQLSRLEEAGLIASQRVIERKHTLTTAGLTKTGRSQLALYWDQIERIRAHSTRRIASKPEQASPRKSRRKEYENLAPESAT
jgi:DNA-binding transcriptional ArsR family regulator